MSVQVDEAPVTADRELDQSLEHTDPAVNATAISLDDAAVGYAAFDKGAAQKFVIDPHGMVRA